MEPRSRPLAEIEAFPTYFRINSERRIQRELDAAGLELEDIYSVSGLPHYTRFIPVVHQLAILVHWLLDRFELFAPFRMVHVVHARKRA